MRRKVLASVVVPICWLVSVPGVASALDDGLILPRGAFRVFSDAHFYLPFDQRYDPDGDAEPLAADFNRPLDSGVFRLLAPLDPFVGRASLGDARVAIEIDLIEVENALQYGITDRLTVGIMVPYLSATTNVKARLESGPGSSANVGLNPRRGQPGQPPLIPIAAGGIPLTTEDIQALLGPGFAGIPGFGFQRFETTSVDDIGDIEATVKYQSLKTEDWRAVVGGGVRFPTGRVDDPDNLVDFSWGAGAYALLFRLYTEYALSHLWTGPQPAASPGELLLNGTFRYDLVLPDHEVRRVPDDVNNPVTTNKENVSRDLGDKFEFDISARYVPVKDWFLTAQYRYGFKLEDQVSGKKGFNYSSLEDETARTEHIGFVGLSYSTLGLYQDKRFPLPIVVSVYYRNRFAGSNNAFRSQYIGLILQIFF
jgi:hypothetical protein